MKLNSNRTEILSKLTIILVLLINCSLAFAANCPNNQNSKIILGIGPEKERKGLMFDLSKSKLQDEFKSVSAEIKAVYSWLGPKMEFTFNLMKCSKLYDPESIGRLGHLLVDGRDYIPLSTPCGEGTCSDGAKGGSIHQESSSVYPEGTGESATGVELRFPAQKTVFSPTTGKNHPLDITLRLMCGTSTTVENPQMYLDYISNPVMSWNNDTLKIIFYHWSLAGCPQSVLLPPPIGGFFEQLIALVVGLFISLIPICTCLLPICICCCVILTPVLIICGCLSFVIMIIGCVLFFSSRRVKYVQMEDENEHIQPAVTESSVNPDQTPLEPTKTQTESYSGF